jgi:predicted membrane GTPase involved in stress response
MENRNFESILLSLAMGIVSLLLLLHVFSVKNYKKNKLVTAYSAETSQIVNKHLQQTASVIGLEQSRMARENLKTAPKIGEIIRPSNPTARLSYSVDHSPDRFEGNSINDIREKAQTQFKRPEQVVLRELSDEEQLRFYKAMYKERYIQQFIENARRGGYEVELDENDVVVGVSKIKKPKVLLDLSEPLGRQAQ